MCSISFRARVHLKLDEPVFKELHLGTVIYGLQSFSSVSQITEDHRAQRWNAPIPVYSKSELTHLSKTLLFRIGSLRAGAKPRITDSPSIRPYFHVCLDRNRTLDLVHRFQSCSRYRLLLCTSSCTSGTFSSYTSSHTSGTTSGIAIAISCWTSVCTSGYDF